MYFVHDDHQAVCADAFTTTPTYQKFLQLHCSLKTHLQNTPLELHAIDATSLNSVTTHTSGGALAIQYGRSSDVASSVERRMGGSNAEQKACRHAAIEMRLSQSHFVIEYVLSPDAWWDQHNLVGKMMVDRHRQTLYKKIQALGNTFRLGFWQGTELGEMHLTAEQCRWIQVLDEWIGTFEPGKDWFRLGVWYEPEAAVLNEDHIVDEIVKQMTCLYPIYNYVLWASGNNYHSFYQKLAHTTY